jgi:hypothetical protein
VNILVDESGQLGVIDWESARSEDLPLIDFFYAVVDAVAAVQRYANRAQAVANCFAPGCAAVSTVAPITARVRDAVEVPAEVPELCFHACWLCHAADEHQKEKPRRPFLQIVQWLALHLSQFNEQVVYDPHTW